MMRLLVTGFESFGGSPVNPSQLVVESLAGLTLDDVELSATILPVDCCAAPEALLSAISKTRPEAVLCLGEAARRPVLSIERIALNLLDFRIPDNTGRQVEDAPVVPDGPAAYFSTLPVRRLATAVSAAGVPVELSLSAGTFLCNQVMYLLLHHLATHEMHIPAGFIHLPSLPEQACKASFPIPSMCLDTSLCGVLAAVEALQDPARGPKPVSAALLQKNYLSELQTAI